MKTCFLLLAGIALTFLPATSTAFDDIQILPSRIKLDSSKNRSKGNTNVESKDIAYSVKVTSSSFKELTNVAVKYNIFYQVAELGGKGDPDIKISVGSNTIPSLLTNKPVDFETEPIKLAKASLDPGWYFVNGASASTQDKVVGVWLRAFDSTGKQIGEYMNPGSLSTKQRWKD
jgi:hypothetical protein